ncbi:MAG: hypothetical protein F4188_04250 [Chloroflexi bacterium]|nr:hypothetical protein [Chloroflexota bacterium]
MPPAVSVERPEPEPDSPVVNRVIEFPVLEPKRPQAFNGAAQVFDLELRQQYPSLPPLDEASNGSGGAVSLRRSIVAAAMIGAGVGLALSLLYPRRGR